MKRWAGVEETRVVSEEPVCWDGKLSAKLPRRLPGKSVIELSDELGAMGREEETKKDILEQKEVETKSEQIGKSEKKLKNNK